MVACDEMSFCVPAFDAGLELVDGGEWDFYVRGRIFEFLFKRIAIEYDVIRLGQKTFE